MSWYDQRDKLMRAEWESGKSIEEIAEKWQLEKDYVKIFVARWKQENEKREKFGISRVGVTFTDQQKETIKALVSDRKAADARRPQRNE